MAGNPRRGGTFDRLSQEMHRRTGVPVPERRQEGIAVQRVWREDGSLGMCAASKMGKKILEPPYGGGELRSPD